MRDVLGSFWSQVHIKGANECWLWTSTCYPGGYGRFWIGREQIVRSHRFALELNTRQPIPPGFFALHSCDVPRCVNPRHLRVGTQSDNMHDAVRRGRNVLATRTHCSAGHEFTPENTYRYPSGQDGRRCRLCATEQMRRKRARGRAA